MPKITFVDPTGVHRDIEAPVGKSVMEIAQEGGIDIEGACEGGLAFSTCHVIVDPDWYDKLKPPAEEEMDMLDLAFDLSRTSRLCCQITMSDDLDGLLLNLPNETRNMLR